MTNSKRKIDLERVTFACQIARGGLGFAAFFGLAKQLLLQAVIVSIAWELSTEACFALAILAVLAHVACCLILLAYARDSLVQRMWWSDYRWAIFSSSTLKNLAVSSFIASAVLLGLVGWLLHSGMAVTYIAVACSALIGAAIDATAIVEIVRKYDIVHNIPNPLIDRTPLEHIPDEYR
jgi:hypothetical protein